VLGKGCVGIVVKAMLDGSPIALKIRRDDADRPSMINEATMLRLANSVEAGPRLTTATRDFLAMELFDGLPLFKWVEQFARQSEVRRILRDLLYSCFRLDSIGLDHGELSHAPKNILVSKGGKACIVDFESASTTRRVANVTSLLQYFLFGRISKTIRASKLFPRRRTILGTLSEYKQEPSVENFQIILGTLGLA
jgi:putative serine/threonine protein kinase